MNQRHFIRYTILCIAIKNQLTALVQFIVIALTVNPPVLLNTKYNQGWVSQNQLY